MDYFGIREVCNVTLRALRNIPACRSMTGKDIRRGEPVMYFDYLKVSNVTGNVTTVYASGGRGNPRRMSWDGDKEVTFHIEDAMISPTSLAILTAAQLIKRRVIRKNINVSTNPATDGVLTVADGDQQLIILPKDFDKNSFMSWGVIKATANGDEVRIYSDEIEMEYDPNCMYEGTDIGARYKLNITSNALSEAVNKAGGTVAFTVDQLDILQATSDRPVYKHEKYTVTAVKDGELELKHEPFRDANHPMFIFDVHDDGSIDLLSEIGTEGNVHDLTTIGQNKKTLVNADIYDGNDYIVDYYRKVKGNVTSLIITADGTSDYYKLEGETLMKRDSDGQDVPLAITIPKVRPRAQFEIPMSNTGDPAVFSFDFDVFPANDSTYASCDNNVMIIMDIIEDDDEECNCVYNSLHSAKDEEAPTTSPDETGEPEVAMF